jgi:8-oxo-dGTP diphosphatase
MSRVPRLTVDGIVRRANEILLVQRAFDPFKGFWALPGGFVEYGETVEEAVRREVAEETGLLVHPSGLAGVYSDPGRDPRGHTVSVVFYCEVVGGALAGDHEVQALHYFPLTALPTLAFDHEKIIHETVKEM